jgi:hypothetical protein
MIVVTHQTIRMHLPARLRASFAAYLQKGSPIDVVAKDCLAPVASIQEVIKSAFVLDPDLAGHDLTFTKIAVAASTTRAIRSAKFRASKVRTDPFCDPSAIGPRWNLG